MRDYELLLVIRPTLDAAAAVDLSKEISELVKAREGQVNATNVWGRRKLAYSIDNHIEATYILQKIQISPPQLPDLEFNLKLNESLLRYLIVRDHQPVVTELQDSETDETEVETKSEASEPPVSEAANSTDESTSTTVEASRDSEVVPSTEAAESVTEAS